MCVLPRASVLSETVEIQLLLKQINCILLSVKKKERKNITHLTENTMHLKCLLNKDNYKVCCQ